MLIVFVCLRFHLQAVIVSDFTKEAFIMTLRRFVARRGKPDTIFSDNNRNFVAAANNFYFSKVISTLTKNLYLSLHQRI